MKNQNLDIWKFGIQVFFSTVMIVLCSSLIFFRGNDSNQAVYWSALSGVIAYWLPSPASSQESGKSASGNDQSK
ncbi:hypothetical protein [Calothrix sp. PCC 7507]|uniref:hypothetical protein n=1 Tax=Calothrix sp. PCC 7507 TaxID=99598 RepID=UPI00029F02B3|nr:hypothetical protein [Calothrix sp. PCC 7507]AFY33768.1 hypothetical protein Cal7507_3366 [Calothrix sp. PCC 7507]